MGETVVKQFDVEIGLDHLFLDEGLDDAVHSVAIQRNDRFIYLDFSHGGGP